MGLEFSSALVLSFVGANLFIHGLPLYLIFLYFGLEFLFRAAFSPLSAVLNAKFGFKKTIIIANVFLVIYFLWLGFINPNSVLGFMSFAIHALARGIYYPTKHHIQANFIDNKTRGRFLTLEIVITAICGALAVGVATYSLVVWQTFLPAALLACFFMGISLFSVLKLLGDLPKISSGSYQAVISQFRSLEFRKDRAAFAGFGLNIGFNNVVVSLLVFFVVDSLRLFGIVIAAVFIVEMLLTLVFGRFIDKHRLASNKWASFFQIGSYVSFALALGPFLVAIIKTTYDLIWNVFDSSFTARFHQKIKHQGLIYACAKEVTLGLSCAAYCGILSLTAYMFTSRTIVFAVALMMAAMGVIIAWRNFRDL